MKTPYDNIIVNIETDLTTNLHGQFSNEDLKKIYRLAKDKLDDLIKSEKPKNDDDLQKIWHEMVVDFHTNGYWGFKKSHREERAPEAQKEELSLATFIPTFLVPLIFTKTALLYFGINWGNHPGQGYGYGFFASIVFAVSTFSYFLWRNRKYKED